MRGDTVYRVCVREREGGVEKDGKRGEEESGL